MLKDRELFHPACARVPTTPVFDFGGVLIDWNPRYLYRSLFAGDEAAMEDFLARVCTPAWNLAQDAGRPFALAVAELATQYPEQAPLIRAYHERWEDMVAGAFDDTVALLYALKQRGLPLYGLSNWSAETFALTRARFPFFELFDGIVISGTIGLTKPDPAIYRYLTDTFALDPADCVFIDDVPANVQGAVQAGMSAIHYRTPAQLRDALRALGFF